MRNWIAYIILVIGISESLSAQTIIQNFNQSVNQIGDCWQMQDMTITTKNTINKANQKKALTGTVVNGNPAYHFTSPIIEFNGTGLIEFKHKLDNNNGTHRELQIQLLDVNENVLNVIHSHVYIDSSSGTTPNGNPTNVYQTSLPITFSGIYILRFNFISSGGSSFAMVDDISIDGQDMSDPNNDNGFGYCRADDVVCDTICAGENELYTVPYPVAGSDWNWSFFGATGARIDTSIVMGPEDTTAGLSWMYNSLGDYILIATEIKPPYNTTTYSVHYNIHVLEAPTLSWAIDSVCQGEMHTASLNFTGEGPWDVTFNDGDSSFTKTFLEPFEQINLGVYDSTRTLQIQAIQGANGCYGDTQGLQQVTWVRGKPILGPIWHY